MTVTRDEKATTCKADRLDAEALTRALLEETLGLGGAASTMTDSSPLLGAIPELDSLGLAALLAGIEQAGGITINEDDMKADAFATFGTLRAFVASQLEAHGNDAQPRR